MDQREGPGALRLKTPLRLEAQVSTARRRDPRADIVLRDVNQKSLRTPETGEDVRLMSQVAEGDRDAFQCLYQRWAGRLLAVIKHQCQGVGDAEDLLQDVFLAVWRKAASYDRSRGDVGGWLYTICRHRTIDRFRRHRPSEPLESVEVPVPAASPELRVDLEQALTHLEPRESVALRMAYFDGLTYEETAHRLEVPVGTLKSRIRTGLRKMASRLET